jgi:hypothetical protein
MANTSTPATLDLETRLDVIQEFIGDLIGDQLVAGRMTQSEANRWRNQADAIVRGKMPAAL